MKNEFTSLDEALSWLENNLSPHPDRPTKPTLSKYEPTPKEYREYASALEAYANEKEQYDELLKEYRSKKMDLEAVVQKFIWKNTGLDSVVPEQYRAKVWSRAYDLGHSYGYSEIQNHLLDLVEIFE